MNFECEVADVNNDIPIDFSWFKRVSVDYEQSYDKNISSYMKSD